MDEVRSEGGPRTPEVGFYREVSRAGGGGAAQEAEAEEDRACIGGHMELLITDITEGAEPGSPLTRNRTTHVAQAVEALEASEDGGETAGSTAEIICGGHV